MVGRLDTARVRFDEEHVSVNKRAWLYFMAPVSAGRALLGDTFEPHGSTVATEILVSVPYDGTPAPVLSRDILVSASPVDIVSTNGTKEYSDTDWRDCYMTLSDVLELLETAEQAASCLAPEVKKGILLGMAAGQAVQRS